MTADSRGTSRWPRPQTLLQAALEQLRLEGAIFFRSELTEGFAFESTPLALADALHPGAERVDPVPHRRPRLVLGRRSTTASATGRARAT